MKGPVGLETVKRSVCRQTADVVLLPATTTWRLSKFGCRTLFNVVQACLGKASQRGASSSNADVSTKVSFVRLNFAGRTLRGPLFCSHCLLCVEPLYCQPLSAVDNTQHSTVVCRATSFAGLSNFQPKRDSIEVTLVPVHTGTHQCCAA